MDDYVGGKKMAGTIINYYDDDDDGVFPSQRDMWTSKWGKEVPKADAGRLTMYAHYSMSDTFLERGFKIAIGVS